MSSGDNGHENGSFTYRVAIYARYSSEMQNEISLEDQVTRCREEIARRGWRVAGVYTDSARSGWSLDRDGFQEMRAAAEKGRFDALMFWKFDRLARDHNHTVMIKALLRHQCGLKLYCVEGVSEDDDDSPYAALVEQMIAVFAAFYSRNLSSDTKRAKRARAMRGEFNGSVAPLGYLLVRKEEDSSQRPAGLYADPALAPIVAEAFARYAIGRYSDTDIAGWLNAQPAIQAARHGQKPLGKDTVRDLLQNRIYTGQAPYSETLYDGSALGQRKKARAEGASPGSKAGTRRLSPLRPSRPARRCVTGCATPAPTPGRLAPTSCPTGCTVLTASPKTTRTWPTPTMARCALPGMTASRPPSTAAWPATGVTASAPSLTCARELCWIRWWRCCQR